MSGYQRIVAYDRSLFPSNPSLSDGILQHSPTILSLPLFLFLFSVHCFRYCTPPFPQAYPASSPPPPLPPSLSLSTSRYFLHKPASFLSSIPCRSFPPNLHSIPLLSSHHSIPKYCNFSLVATTALQLRNDKFLARLPCLSRCSSPPPLRTALSSFRRQPLRVSSAVKLVRSIDSID